MKVLLRERKRHTNYGVSSTPSAVLSQGGGTLERGVGTLGYPLPHWNLDGGGRYPGVPLPPQDLAREGNYLGQGVGTLGYPLPHQDLARG